MKGERRRLLAKVAYLYFVVGKSQTEIAEDLGIYRTTISRMVTQARDEGIVNIEINEYDVGIFALEEYVQSKFGVRKVEIVSNEYYETQESLMDEIAKRAAAMVRNSIREKDIVGISWGSSLSKMVDKIEPRNVKNVSFCPLAGGPSHINARYHVNTLVYEMSRIFHGKSTYINAMVVQGTEQLAFGILGSKYFEELLMLWNALDLAIVGIGGELDHNTSQWRDLLTEDDYSILEREGAIGELCCRFFDSEGEIVHRQLQKRIIGITLEQLACVPTSIAIAQGENKAQAILAILRKGYVNHLVTDRKTILKVLELDKDEEGNRFFD
ncbi:sugar-binding transcriptional regulator [uncultured Trichococcus sp.]|uniref:sugar-binding transcriptional regulator n=1 Tax=uncultured Trichococcus sp. TaxID=189665 RepID=UPI0029C73B12|nr:sugar-binding transcriptional regulator [uncultured Trichococcus sp.]